MQSKPKAKPPIKKPNAPYAIPSAMGGTLIRKVIQNFKAHGFTLPITEPIFIATSGGVDSMALAHLLSRYGRKVATPHLITLLHFDHQWRKESATVEKAAVKNLARDLGVGFKSVKLDPPKGKGNAEEDARKKRTDYYFKVAGPPSGAHIKSSKAARYLLTAHHQDDVAETLFWRFLRGEFLENTQGILFLDDPVLRPFLQVSKEEIYEYAHAEQIAYFEDSTNQNDSQMRAFLRGKVFPLLEKRFPSMKSKLASYANRTHRRNEGQRSASITGAVEQLTSRLNRAQREQISRAMQSDKNHSISLPGGVVLTRGKAGFFLRFPDRES